MKRSVDSCRLLPELSSANFFMFRGCCLNWKSEILQQFHQTLWNNSESCHDILTTEADCDLDILKPQTDTTRLQRSNVRRKLPNVKVIRRWMLYIFTHSSTDNRERKRAKKCWWTDALVMFRSVYKYLELHRLDWLTWGNIWQGIEKKDPVIFSNFLLTFLAFLFK